SRLGRGRMRRALRRADHRLRPSRPQDARASDRSRDAASGGGGEKGRRVRRLSMRSGKVIHVVSCHAEGEVGDVIVGGVPPPPGASLWEQSRFLARDGTLRNFLLNEPRGG